MSRREKLRQEMITDIKKTARDQMANNGTAAVSLSAIARQLEVSQPALYRYYASRDDLITALIVDAYSDLAQSLEETDAALPPEEYRRRLLAVLTAYREWAITHPVDFQLIYGNPIPGYQAPFQVTAPAAQRTFQVILGILAAAYSAGALQPGKEHVEAARTLGLHLPVFENSFVAELPPVILYFGVRGWYHIHGMIMLELFHHTEEIVLNAGTFYSYEVEELINNSGFQS